jgi:hypothetical protein
MQVARSLPDFAALHPGYKPNSRRLFLKFDPLVGTLEIDMERLAQAV